MKVKDTQFTWSLNLISRWFVGLVFLFSSFVKGVDPMGTAYKIQDYMTAWSVGGLTFEWALPLATPLSLTLVTCEFLIGVLLIMGCYRNFTAWLLSAFMAFFTVTTLVDAITNAVTDCGCFGDFVKLTNWQTFWKNIVLDVFTVWIFMSRRQRVKRRFERDTLVAAFAIAAMLIFGIYNINNEPCIDFRPWKVGNQMIDFSEDMQVKSFVTYKNLASGEEKEFPSEQLVELMQDSNFEQEWEWVSSRVEDPTEIKAAGFSMLDMDMVDHAQELIGEEGYLMIATIHHLDKMDADGIAALKRVASYAENNDIHLVVLSSAMPEEMEPFLHDNDLDYLEFFFADATAIETMLRSNPGFIMLNHAKVMGKWHWRNTRQMLDFPLEER